jgi:signal transduction histidine kinase
MGATGDDGCAASGENGPVTQILGWLLRPVGPLPRPRRRALLVDAVLAAVLGLASFQAATGDPPGVRRPIPPGAIPPLPPVPPADPPGTDLGAFVLVLVLCAPLILRRRYPLAVLWTTIGASLLVLVPGAIDRPNLYPCVVLASLIALFSAAAYSPHRLPALAGPPVVALLGLWLVAVPGPYLPFLVLAPVVAAAGGHHLWKRRAGEDRERMAAQAREQAQALRDAAAGERARIARELHDVVTHHVSVMVIQAGAARLVLAGSPQGDTRQDEAREALLAVESTGRAALTELRHVMGLLAPAGDPTAADSGDTDDGQGALVAAPQPGLERLPVLVGRMRDAGVPVRLTVSGDVRPIADGVGLAAYRVVQEALTNTVRHAAGAAATVVVEVTPEHLRIEVTDTGGHATTRKPGGPGGPGGRGLIGLRERLAVYGGTLHTEARPGAGYRVEAQIPLEAA